METQSSVDTKRRVTSLPMKVLTNRAYRSPSQRLLHYGPDVHQRVKILERWRPVSPDYAVDLFLCLSLNLGVQCHRKNKPHHLAGGLIANIDLGSVTVTSEEGKRSQFPHFLYYHYDALRSGVLITRDVVYSSLKRCAHPGCLSHSGEALLILFLQERGCDARWLGAVFLMHSMNQYL